MLALAANEWSRNLDSWFFAVIKTFHTEKFLREFSFISISSLNILAFYMYPPYKVVLYTKSVYSWKLITLLQKLSVVKL